MIIRIEPSVRRMPLGSDRYNPLPQPLPFRVLYATDCEEDTDTLCAALKYSLIFDIQPAHRDTVFGTSPAGYTAIPSATARPKELPDVENPAEAFKDFKQLVVPLGIDPTHWEETNSVWVSDRPYITRIFSHLPYQTTQPRFDMEDVQVRTPTHKSLTPCSLCRNTLDRLAGLCAFADFRCRHSICLVLRKGENTRGA